VVAALDGLSGLVDGLGGLIQDFFSFFVCFKSLTVTGKYKTPASVNLLMEAGKSNRLRKSRINRDLSLEAVGLARLHKKLL
jgi:hypothetical protein